MPDHADQRAVNLASQQCLFPSDGGSSSADEIVVHLVRQPALQLRDFLQSFAFHECLAVWALFPAFIDRLVAADVNVAGGEHVHRGVQDVFEEDEGGVASDAEQVTTDEVLGRHLVLFPGAAEVGVGCDG